MFYDFISQAGWSSLLCASALVFFGLGAISTASGLWIERSSFARAHRVFALEVPPGQIRREGFAWVRFNLVAAGVLSAALFGGLFEFTAGGLSSGVATFGVCWFSFEVYYWLMHRAMHTKPLFRFHRWHHDSKVTTAFTGLSTSMVEAVGWALGFVLGPVLLSLVGAQVSLGGFAAYLAYNYSGNIVGHINAEFFPPVLARRGGTWLMHPIVYHALHHARFRNHYGFGSTFMDRALGTEWKDWGELFLRVRGGQPLRALSERGNER